MATAAVQLPTDILSNVNSLQRAHAAPVTATEERKLGEHDVNTTLNFFKDNADGSSPHPTYVGKPETYERPVDTHPVTVTDVSGHEAEYTLDSHGFQFVSHVSQEKDFIDEDAIKDGYYKEVEQLLKDVTGATRIFIFDHTIRRQPLDSRNQATPAPPLRGPVKRVHIDQSASAALSRVPFHLPAEAEALLRGRVQLINVWRPIRRVLRDPLGVAASQSVRDEDLVPIPLIYPNRAGETLSVRHHPAQRWFYKWHQTPGEPLLIKCFDSRAGDEWGGRARRVPHTAFEVPGTEEEESRESIEVRALVFHEE